MIDEPTKRKIEVSYTPILGQTADYTLKFEEINNSLIVYLEGNCSFKAYKFIYVEISSMMLISRYGRVIVIDNMQGCLSSEEMQSLIRFFDRLDKYKYIKAAFVRTDGFGNYLYLRYIRKKFQHYFYALDVFDNIHKAVFWLNNTKR